MPRLSCSTPAKRDKSRILATCELPGVNICSYLHIKIHTNIMKTLKAPKEEHQSLYKGPEVVVLVDSTLSIFFNLNVSKKLPKQSQSLSLHIRRQCNCSFNTSMQICIQLHLQNELNQTSTWKQKYKWILFFIAGNEFRCQGVKIHTISTCLHNVPIVIIIILTYPTLKAFRLKLSPAFQWWRR